MSASNYLEPLRTDTLIRHQLLKLFTDAGLEDFQAQILLSVVLHGGQIKPQTLANDLGCSAPRLKLPDALPSLIHLNLISTSHNKPQTVILSLKMDEFVDRLAMRSLNQMHLFKPIKAIELLNKIDNLAFKSENIAQKKEKTHPPLKLIDYFDAISFLISKIPTLFYLIDISVSSLRLERNQAVILASLFENRGKTVKRDFYLNIVKKVDIDQLKPKIEALEKDLLTLGYKNDESVQIIDTIQQFYQQKSIRLQYSTEQYFNLILENMSQFCHSTSMETHGKKGKAVNLVITKSLSEIAEILYQPFQLFQQTYKNEIINLKMAYSNVKLIDREIFLSSIADPSSTKKRLRKDLEYAKKVNISLLHDFFISELFYEISDSNNLDFELQLIIAEEQKDKILEQIKKHIQKVSGKRGLLPNDLLTVISSIDIPQDILDDNTVILYYDIGSSMITIHEEISKKNPIEINTIISDVDNAANEFNKLIRTHKDTKTTTQLINNLE
jgi:hypothetical protein